MGKFDDSITIARSPQDVQALLADLERHPAFVPDGFKRYRYLSRETKGVGARAAIEINLLGHWLPAELQVLNATPQQVVLHVDLEPASLELRSDLIDRGGRTEVRLTVNYERRTLSPWRVRTRIKQRLRLPTDVATLFGRFLSSLKKAAESEPSTPKGPGAGSAAPTGSTGAAAGKPAGPAGSSSTPTGSAGPATGKATAPMGQGAAPAASPPAASAPSAASTTATSVSPAPSGASPSAPAEFVTAGLEAEITPGQSRVVKVGPREVAVFNINGDFYAISNTCPHRGGALGFGVLDGPVVACPLHGWTFDVTSGKSTTIDGLVIPMYEVRRVNGEVQVRSTPIAA